MMPPAPTPRPYQKWLRKIFDEGGKRQALRHVYSGVFALQAFQAKEDDRMRHAILPHGEHVKRAVRWISDRRQDRTEIAVPVLVLVDEAARRFDLSPLEEEWMIRTFVEPPPRSND